jgi:hypothetical protein
LPQFSLRWFSISFFQAVRHLLRIQARLSLRFLDLVPGRDRLTLALDPGRAALRHEAAVNSKLSNREV